MSSLSTALHPPAGTLALPLPIEAPRLRAATSRLVALDATRILAGLGVIWFHSVESSALRASGVLGRFSVAFYTMAAMIFLLQSLHKRPDQTWRDFIRAKFVRLYVPFLGWSLLGLALLALAHRISPGVPAPELSLDTFAAGTTEPLWFIPFLCLALIVAFPLARWMLVARRRQIGVALACVAIALVLDYGWWWGDAPVLRLPLAGKAAELGWNRWSAVYWGLAFAALWHGGLKTWPRRAWLSVAGALLLAGPLVWQWIYGEVSALKVVGGFGLLLVALGPWTGPAIAWLARLGPCCFGLYFAHMPWIWAWRAVANHYGVPLCWQRDAAVFLLATLLSLVTVKVFAQTKALDWLVV
jgi:surface polysaccharide O-acyltransferase-like enzyme